jgi:hypothetical protein
MSSVKESSRRLANKFDKIGNPKKRLLNLRKLLSQKAKGFSPARNGFMSLAETVKELKKIKYLFPLEIKVLYLERNGFVEV